MLMDLFFGASAVVRKRRAHFHEFMSDVHERVREFRLQLKLGAISDEDPIRLAAAAIAEETWLLCFDEFHVTDIADAMILGRLFARLFELGVVVVTTSNVAPDELYKDGLNRALFLPFIALIEERMAVGRLAARTDFRLEEGRGQSGLPMPRGCRRRRGARPSLAPAHRRRFRDSADTDREGPRVAGAARRHGRGTILVPRLVRTAARRLGLSADCARLPHRDPRPHSGDGRGGA